MKKKIFSIALTLAFLCALVLPVLPVDAGPPGGIPPGQLERLEHGWQRLNPHTKVHIVGTEMKGDKEYFIVDAIIDSLPSTLEDNQTLIDTCWYSQIDASGQSYFQSGVNTFTARVLGGRVSVEDENGHLTVWNPTVHIGNAKFDGGQAVITDDPINPFLHYRGQLLSKYTGNCLRWDYGEYSTGWLSSATLTRYLRVIEGSISDLWILPENPRTDVIIRLNETSEFSCSAHITWVEAYDADHKPLRVTGNKFGSYVISASEFVDKTFPVTIDPTFTTSSSDGYFGGVLTEDPYATVHDRTYGDPHSSDTYIAVGQYSNQPGWFTIWRSYVYFNTSSIPSEADIDDAYLKLYGGEDSSTADFYIQVQSGMPIYPHEPLIGVDYNYTHYSGNGGTLSTASFTTSGYNNLYLGATGEGWINKSGWTKFCLRSTEDINSSPPATGVPEYVGIYSYEKGAGFQPQLYVTYTVPIDPPTVSTRSPTDVHETHATLEGRLTDDGGEDCSVRFQYGTSTSYGTDTSWRSGYDTGDYFDKTVYGLSPGTTYHYRAQAINSAGTRSGYDETFTTLPYEPYNFTATAGDSTVALTWSKGSGADKTMIRRSTTSYPTSPIYGTQIYFNTGTSHDDDTAVNDTTYYYSAWSEESGEYSAAYVSDSATPSGPESPTVTTNAATNVGTTTATLNLYLDDLGGYASTDVWFQYYKGAGTWTDNETTPSTKTSPCSHSAGIATLTTATLYHMRAAAQNTSGTSYGADVPFTTDAPCAPTMTTQSATGLQLRAATLNGVVTDDGDASVTAWFEWGLTTSYGHETPSISGLSSSDTFYYGLTGLEPGTTYHYRAIGQNSVGISYGDDVEFVTTTPTAPTCRTDAASDVGANQAILNATVLTDGDVECEVRFQWGTTVEYGNDTEWVSGYSAPQTFSRLITGLTIGETYHFRAQVKNDGGTGDGSDVTFTTTFGAPTNFRAKAISSTTVNLTWSKSGDLTYIRYKVDGFPIDRADGNPVYNGPDEFTSISGLMPGVTYYFRAWSWREGDVWAEGYADDVSTTQATVPAGEEEEPEMVTTPEEPATWFQTPSGAAITKMPFYGPIVGLAEAYEIPEGSMWLVIALVITIMASVLAFSVVHKAFVAVVAGGFVICSCGALGMIPLWFIAVYVALGGGAIFVTSRM